MKTCFFSCLIAVSSLALQGYAVPIPDEGSIEDNSGWPSPPVDNEVTVSEESSGIDGNKIWDLIYNIVNGKQNFEMDQSTLNDIMNDPDLKDIVLNNIKNLNFQNLPVDASESNENAVNDIEVPDLNVEASKFNENEFNDAEIEDNINNAIDALNLQTSLSNETISEPELDDINDLELEDEDTVTNEVEDMNLPNLTVDSSESNENKLNISEMKEMVVSVINDFELPDFSVEASEFNDTELNVEEIENKINNAINALNLTESLANVNVDEAEFDEIINSPEVKDAINKKVCSTVNLFINSTQEESNNSNLSDFEEALTTAFDFVTCRL